MQAHDRSASLISEHFAASFSCKDSRASLPTLLLLRRLFSDFQRASPASASIRLVIQIVVASMYSRSFVGILSAAVAAPSSFDLGGFEDSGAAWPEAAVSAGLFAVGCVEAGLLLAGLALSGPGGSACPASAEPGLVAELV